MSTPPEAAQVAVAIPCYNEAAAIGTVIDRWKAALPQADVVVFDNNSTDDSARIAREHGARVVSVPQQGKGHAVQAIFTALPDCAAIVLVDGDGTYPAEAVGSLLEPVLAGSVDMAVGARQPVENTGAMSPVRGIGNILIRAAFRVLIGRGTGDLLSGYRVFGRQFRSVVQPRSAGFEIEAELASEAVAHRLRVVEVPVPYYPRIAGTTSKLKAFRDGRRILATIFRQSVRYRPWRPLLLLVALLVVVALILQSWPVALVAGSVGGAAAAAATAWKR